jgi:hypothetical protein
MKLSLKILENNSTIEKAILRALLPEVALFMDKVYTYVKDNLFSIIKFNIESQPEYESLINGKLRLELGIPDAENRIKDLINVWINNAVIDYKKPQILNSKIKSTFSIKMINVNFSDVLNLNISHIEHNAEGSTIPWLEWLLLEGTAVLVDNYEVYIGPNNRSRTGYAIMKSSDNRGWSMPPEYAGTINDNWITRAIDSAKPSVQKLLEKALSQ